MVCLSRQRAPQRRFLPRRPAVWRHRTRVRAFASLSPSGRQLSPSFLLLSPLLLASPTRPSSSMSPATNASGASLDGDGPAALVAPLNSLPLSTSETSSLDDKHDVEKADFDDDKQAQRSSDVLEAKELSPMEAFAVDVGGEQSPFAEVAACVPNTDDPDMLVSSASLSPSSLCRQVSRELTTCIQLSAAGLSSPSSSSSSRASTPSSRCGTPPSPSVTWWRSSSLTLAARPGRRSCRTGASGSAAPRSASTLDPGPSRSTLSSPS